jgi:hypothetical protein
MCSVVPMVSIRWIRPSVTTACGGGSRVLDTVGRARADIEDDCRHVKAGGYLVAIRAPRSERTPIVEARAHGRHSIRYFGPLTNVDLPN